MRKSVPDRNVESNENERQKIIIYMSPRNVMARSVIISL